MNNVVNNIAKGKKLEESLPLYAGHMMNLYNQMAHMQFTMNYYTYYEVLAEYAGNNKNDIENILKQLNSIVESSVLNRVMGTDRENAVDAISKLRDSVTETMRILTTYVDFFSRYEYVANRIEYRFRDEHIPADYSDEEMARKILRYIISDDDNAVINSKISEMIGQLPVRMIKNKFYEYVNEGVNVYSEADKRSFDDYMYMLRSAALLDRPEGFDDRFPEFSEILNQFSEIKFSQITEEEYKKLSEKLTYVTDAANEMVDIYMMATELINAVYVIILATPYVDESAIQDICVNIDRNIYNLFMDGQYVTIDETTESLMSELEGKPEDIAMQCSSSEYALDTVRAEYMDMTESIMCNHTYEALFMCQKLLSGSLFVDLSDNSDDAELESEYFEEQKKHLLNNLADVFASSDKMINRSIMAAVLATLPVFFNNMEEVKEYVISALDNCRDEAEKLGCIEIINNIIEAD